jgi:DNA-binding SARP family transcriptional activator/WD40 repeat protein
MEFRVLGPLEVVREGDHLALGGPKQRAVLALLLARAGNQVPTDTLIYGIYGDAAPERAHRSIHTYVSNLRGELNGVVEREGDGYVLRAEPAQIDAVRFEGQVRQAGQEDDPSAVGELLRDALALWRGHPYADIDRPSLSPEIARLNELRVAAIAARVDADLETGLDRELLGELDSLAAEHPLHEGFCAQQMLALYRAGRHAEALRAFERTRRYLAEEMGLNPSPELQALEGRILNHDETLLLPRRPTVRTAAVLVSDLDAGELGQLAPHKRSNILTEQALAIESAIVDHRGHLFAHTGTTTFAWFDSAESAVEAAIAIGRQASSDAPGLRAAVAVGDLEVTNPDEVSGPPLSRAASLVATAHPGQTLLAAGAHEEVARSGAAGLVIRSLGPHDIPGLADGELVYQLGVDGNVDAFPPLLVGSRPAVLPSHEIRVPGYELRERIRSSFLGVIHRGYQPSAGREVLIKVIQPELANSPGFIRRFEVEAQMVSRLEHPRIVPLLDHWREPDTAYLVMRWMHGGTLADRIESAPLSLDEMTPVVEAVGEALAYAHRNGVAHGSIDPASVVFDGEGNAYLSEFSVAHHAGSDTDIVAGDILDLAMLIGRSVAETDRLDEFLSAASTPGGFADVSTLVQAWRRATGKAVSDPAKTLTDTRNPYKGLRAFSELDAADFYGRREETHKLLATVAERRLVAVIGPSGVGKSSVVRAGLIPQLRSGALPGSAGWLIVDMIPGASPYQELASALLRVASEQPTDIESELRSGDNGLVRAAKRYLPPHSTLLLVIDQFEELFTLVHEAAERDRFLALISHAVSDDPSPVRIVITMRADFFDRPLGSGSFGDVLGEATVPFPAPSAEGLREMIEMPAAAVGVAFEPGLVERIAADVKDQPGALPLLEFSLTDLFDRRTADVITFEGYEETGGVAGALGRRAELIHGGLGAEAQNATREVFLRLVNVTDAGRDTRRRIRRSELAHLGIESGAIEEVVRGFGEQRLLTFDRDPVTRGPTVEVAHEAILGAWPRLAEWIDGYREDLLLRGRLAAAVDEWEESGRSNEYLLTGGRLTQHEAWTADTDLGLSASEMDYLSSSRAAEDDRRAGRRRSRRRVLTSLSAAAIVAVLLATVAWVQRNRAEHARMEAAARELSLQARDQLGEDPELSLLLAIEAVRSAQEADADLLTATTALRSALAENRILARHEGGLFVDVSPDGSLFATAELDGAVIIRELASGTEVAGLTRPGVQAIGASFSPDGQQLAVHYATANTPVWLWHLSSRSHRAFSGPDPSGARTPTIVSFDDTGRYLAAGSGGEVTVWGTDDGSELAGIETRGEPLFLPGADLLMVTDFIPGEGGPRSSLLRSFDTGTWEESSRTELDIVAESIAVSPDGRLLVASSASEQRVAAYDVSADFVQVWEQTVSRPYRFAWVEGSAWVAVGSDGGQISLLDAESGGLGLTLDRGHVGGVWSVADAGAGRIISAGFDGTSVVWNANPGPRAEVAEVRTGVELVRAAGFAPYPSRVLVTDRADRSALILDAGSGELVREIQDSIVGTGVETWTMAEGRVVGEVTSSGSGLIRDSSTDEVIYTAPDGWGVWGVDNTISYAYIVPIDRPPGHPVNVVTLPDGEVILNVPQAGFPEFSSDGRYALVPTGAGRVDVYSTAERRQVGSWPFALFEPLPNGRTASALDLEGNLWLVDFARLLEGATLDEAKIWSEFATDGPVFMTGHVINADGSLIAVAARTDDPARIWSDDGTLVAVLDSNLTEAPPYIFFHPDAPHVTLLSDGGRLLTYTLDPDELVGIAEERVARSLTDDECRTFMHLDSCT